MYRQLLALSAALLLTLSSSSTEASSSSSTSSSPSSYIRKQPNAYIVELQDRDTNEFFASYPGAKVRYTYDSDILHGASVEFSDPAAAKRALSHKDVVNAWQVGHHTRPSATAGASFHRNDNNNRTLQPLDPDQIQTLTGYSNASRQLNVDGSSVRVGIIDSGVDYRHPALGGCFGTGCRIAYGYDLVGDDYDGSPDSIRPDADPLDDCPAGAVGATGHGTFVTGLIGAIDKNYNWTGAAPGAQLGMWRVFGCKSQVSTTDVFIKAMEMAYKADMDVINLSLGENGGWEEDVLAVFADRLVARGVHVVVATGNIGTSGIFLAASPSTGRNVIAVGSLMNTHLPAYILNVTRIDGKYKTDSLAIPYRTIDNSALVQPNATSLVFASDDSDDKCIDKDLDVDDNIVLVPQDGCNLDKQIAAYSKASVIVAYSSSNDSSPTSYSSSGSSSKSPAVAFISGADAKQLFAFVHNSSSNKKKKKHDRPLEAQLTSLLVSVPAPESQAGRFAGFTSLGPTNELRIKPEICALGSDLLSTFPLNLGSYGFLSGTSTSAPLVSAYVALLVDSFKGQKLTAQIVKDSLLNFASPLKSPVLAYPSLGDAPVRQGAGAINVARAVQGLSQFHVSPSALSFNDTEHFEPTQTLTIYNHAKEVLEFRMVHGAALTTAGYDLKNASDFTPQEPISLGVQDPTVATVTFSKNQLSVPAGGSAEVQVNLKVSTHVFAPNSHAIYGGYIGVELDNGSIAASIPYIGMIGNMTDLPILDRSSGSSDLAYPFPSIGNPDGSILGTKETGHYSPGRWPTLLVRLLTGTPLVDVQVLDEHKKLLGSVPYNAMNADSTHEWLPRNTKAATSSSTPYEAWVWTGQYVEQDSSSKEVRTVSSGGVYYLRVRALRVFGDRTSDRDWDTWTSPPMKMNLNSNSSNSSSQSSSTTTTSSIKPSYKPTDTALPISIVI